MFRVHRQKFTEKHWRFRTTYRTELESYLLLATCCRNLGESLFTIFVPLAYKTQLLKRLQINKFWILKVSTINSDDDYEPDVLNTLCANWVKNSKLYKECINELGLLPPRNLAVFERQYFLEYYTQRSVISCFLLYAKPYENEQNCKQWSHHEIPYCNKAVIRAITFFFTVQHCCSAWCVAHDENYITHITRP